MVCIDRHQPATVIDSSSQKALKTIQNNNIVTFFGWFLGTVSRCKAMFMTASDSVDKEPTRFILKEDFPWTNLNTLYSSKLQKH